MTKDELWHCLDVGVFEELGLDEAATLRDVNAVGIYERIRHSEFSRILEIAKGPSLLHRALALKNEVRVAAFDQVTKAGEAEGNEAVSGPDFLPKAFEPNTFDVVLSVNVLSSMNKDDTASLVRNSRTLLRSGGVTIHSLEFCIEDTPSPYWKNRFRLLQFLLCEEGATPLGPIAEELKFSCNMATNPDVVLYGRKSVSPALDGLRRRSQSVSLLFAMRKL